MDLQTLLSYTEPTVEGDRQVKDNRMLTMIRPDGYDNAQYPIDAVQIIDDCVVISLLGVEDATWYDAESFDEEIEVWYNT